MLDKFQGMFDYTCNRNNSTFNSLFENSMRRSDNTYIHTYPSFRRNNDNDYCRFISYRDIKIHNEFYCTFYLPYCCTISNNKATQMYPTQITKCKAYLIQVRATTF